MIASPSSGLFEEFKYSFADDSYARSGTLRKIIENM